MDMTKKQGASHDFANASRKCLKWVRPACMVWVLWPAVGFCEC